MIKCKYNPADDPTGYVKRIMKTVIDGNEVFMIDFANRDWQHSSIEFHKNIETFNFWNVYDEDDTKHIQVGLPFEFETGDEFDMFMNGNKETCNMVFIRRQTLEDKVEIIFNNY